MKRQKPDVSQYAEVFRIRLTSGFKNPLMIQAPKLSCKQTVTIGIILGNNIIYMGYLFCSQSNLTLESFLYN